MSTLRSVAGSHAVEALRLDLRSDAVTLPTDEMWDAMRGANLGWAHVGEDPAVDELVAVLADLAGKEAGLFVTSGSVGNLIAVMSHAERGDQVVLEESSHIAWCEEWGIAYICGVYPKLIAGKRGVLAAEDVRRVLTEQRLRHIPKTSLICIENTHNLAGGAAISAAATAEVAEAAREAGCAVHIDGARIFNAVVALDTTLAQLVHGDSVVVNLNKGFSAPGGAVLLGSTGFVHRCRLNLRRIAALPMQQAGLIAAAGLVGLRTMMPQIAEDNRRARVLGERLAEIPNIGMPFGEVDTNIVICKLTSGTMTAAELVDVLARAGVKALPASETAIRFVTHRHVDDDACEYVAGAVRAALEARNEVRGS
jgi:threonine aldolase